MIEIKHRFSGEVLFKSEKAMTIKEAVLEAIAAKANLTWADLTGADLTEANLTGADLTWADTQKAAQVFHAGTETILYMENMISPLIKRTTGDLLIRNIDRTKKKAARIRAAQENTTLTAKAKEWIYSYAAGGKL